MEEKAIMTVKQVLESGLVDDNTRILILCDVGTLASGSWYEDNILNLMDQEVKKLTWKDNELRIRVKSSLT